MHKPSVIEDIYPLSPMQEGMLFHTLLAPRSGVYVEQQSWSYHGDINIHAFIQAWQLAVDRHPILRTAFLHENREKPLQVVRRRAPLNCSVIDWSDCSPAEQDVLLDRFLNADRRRGFLVSSPSLIRLTLICLGHQSWEVVWTHSHLLLDGWSVPVLLREVGLGYQAFSQGESVRLEPAQPYGRYIAWLKQQDLDAAEKFWRERLHGFEMPTRLGVDQESRLHESESGFGEQRVFLSSQTTASLQALTRLLRVTTNTVIQGVWAIVLGQYSGQDDVVFGATVSGRPTDLAGIEAMVGLFINTVPVRIIIPGAEPVSEWLKRLQQQEVESRRYEYSPLTQIHGWSGVARSQSPFESLLVFENYPVSDVKPRQVVSRVEGNGSGSGHRPEAGNGASTNGSESSGSNAQQAKGAGNGKVEVRNIRAYEQAHYPLSIVAGLIPELIFRLLYDRGRFSESAITRLGRHLQTVLEAILAEPEQPLRTVSLLSSAERQQLIFEWNDTASALPRWLSLVELFEQQVEGSPDSVALSFADGQLTYSALNRRANQLAHHLQHLGLGPSMACGLLLRRSTSLIVSILAVLKAGAVYLPLDLNYPVERLAFMIANAGAEFLLTDGSADLSLSVEQQTVVDLERDALRIAGHREDNLRSQSCGLSVAYINYTSGSTGQPKGILIPHGAVTRLVLNTNYVRLSARDRVAQSSNASFDALTFELWGALLNGARLVGVDQEILLAPLRYARWIRAEQLNVMFMTTALFNQMAREAPWAFQDVQALCFGGEAVDPRWVRELLDQGFKGRLLHVYGPTESTTFSTWQEVESVSAGARTVPIGQAVGNTSVYVLDHRQRLVAWGVEGELCIGGEGLAYGYVGAPAETAASFLPDEWSGQKGTRIYRTGDLVRRGEEGAIEYLGRVDHQVKIRGFRIELGEIGVVLGEHPAVVETVVVARDHDGEKQLVAYVVVKPGHERSKTELRSYLKSRLPEYMVPAVYVWMDRLPLNANGKVDRRALPSPQKEERQGGRRERVGTAAEEIVAGIFEQVLDVSDVSVEDSFFELGGHSLLATQVMSRVREAFKVDVPLRELFDGPTVRELASKVEQLLAAGAGEDAPPLTKLERREGQEIPLSFAQQRLWFLDQLLPDIPIYLNPIALKLDGPLNLPVLEQSLNHIVQRHEVLRTTIGVNGGRAVQVINHRKLELSLVDLSGLTDSERRTTASKLIAEESGRRFDLSRDMLLRARLLQANPRENVLLLTFHHIVTDGWSTGVFVGEFGQLYRVFQQGDPATLPELPIQYADFAVWQRGWLQGAALEKQLEYWRRQLQGASRLLELPIDRPRSVIQASPRHRESFVLSPALSEALIRFGNEQRVTLFMTLLAALEGLLARYTGQTDFCIGSPIANRNRAEVEGLIGFFVNMLVLRAKLSDHPDFSQAVQRARDTTLGAYAHQDIPFELLIEEMEIERSLNHAPLVQVVFTFQNAPAEPLQLPQLQMAALNTGDGASEYDLNLIMSGGQEGLLGSMIYNSDLFDRTTIRRLVGRYQRLLEAVVADPLLPLDAVSLLSEDERHQLLVEWNDSSSAFPSDSSIPLIFEQLAAREPAALALAGVGRHLSYGCLNRRANQLAWHLHSLGVSAETRVALALPRSPEMIIALLAILKAGGAYLPLDPAYPLDRLAFMLEDAEVPVIITQESLVDRLPSHLGHVVFIDGDDAQLDSYPLANLPAAAVADNTAYITYTSGSTGEPKGVEVTHRAVLRLLLGISYVELNADHRLLHLSPLAFDASTFEIWGALLHGGCCVLAEEGVTTGSELEKVIAEQQVRTMWLTSSLFNTVMDYQWTAFRGVEQLLIGGEALSLKHVRAGREKLKGTQIFNGYGPTESTTFTSTWRVDATIDDEVRAVSIGRVIENTQVYVLDHRRQPVGVGVTGELWIGGSGLARGYLNRSPATAERFLPDGVSGKSGGRLYRTGDLARYLPDGRLEYLGRVDHQVKVRGFRIELGEVESVLVQFPGIDEVVAVVREDHPGARRLVAYFVCPGDSSPSDAELRQFMHSRVPDYLVPTVFVKLDRLPLNDNGKVDRKALPIPEFDRAQLQEHYVAPRNDSEQSLAKVWAEVLSVPQVGIRDNYFELGGDSIHSIQVVAKAREHGLSFSIQELFTYPTIEQLFDHLSLRPEPDSAPADVVLTPFALISATDRARMAESVEDAYPLTRLQAGMIFHTELNPETAVYHDIFSFYMEAPLDEEAMAAALRSLIKEHEILRTSVDLTGFSEPLQLVHRDVELPLEIMDLSELTPEQQEHYLAEAIEIEKRSPFEWQRAPLLRLKLYKRSAGKFQFMLSFHHSILDGWSLGVFLTELFQQHSVEMGRTEPVRREPSQVNFRDYVAREQRALQSEASRSYWDQQLQDLVPTKIPRRSNHKSQVPRAKLRRRFIPNDVTAGLYDFARRLGLPLKSVLLASHLRVLSAATGENDVITGVVAHGRLEQQGGDRMLGLFLNTMPFRLRMEGGEWSELVRQVQSVEREVLEHRHYPMAELQKRVAPELLFETTFNFIHFHIYEELMKNEDLKVLGGTDVTETNYPFSTDFALDVTGENLVQSIGYDENEFGLEQIVRLEQYYEKVLIAMSNASEERYERLDVLTAGERQQLLLEWNDTEREYGVAPGVHELVARQAELTPEAVAVVSGEQQLSYGELQRRANQLGHYLRRLGVGPEVLVGVAAERSLELIVALLGVLKAGGAYVPIDPSYPRNRVEYMLADSEVSIVLTQSQVLDQLPQTGARLIALDADWGQIAVESGANPAPLVSGENSIYMIYTSGSTGRPKGAVNTHAGLCNRLRWMQEQYQLTAADRVLQKTPLSFDVSVWEFFWPLLAGARLVFAKPGGHGDPAYLVELIDSAQITTLHFVPSMLQAFVEHPGASRCRSLRQVISSGEALSYELQERFFERLGARLHNLYGPTEASIDVTFRECHPGEERVVPIGRPIANTEIYVLDAELQPVPVGAAGELYLGGVGLARGYLQQAELTATRFVPDPFSREGGARLYRTGDEGRYRWDGEVEYLGRRDEQVKVRGYRIELGEIEAVLREQAGVREAVVVARGVGEQQQLVGYVVSEVARPSGEWREYLAAKLPSYMVPAVVVSLERLPLTANGKVDRGSLPAPELERVGGGRAPRAGREAAVAGIWSEVLGVAQPGAEENFFELGGHSLVAIRVITRVRQVFGVELGVRELFERPTVAGLAAAIAEAQEVVGGGGLPRLERRAAGTRLPLSYAQQRLWFLDQLLGEPAAYNMPSAVPLGAEVGVLVLEQSLGEVVRRHEALRTRFVSEDGVAEQVVEAAGWLRLGLVDLRGLGKHEQAEQERRLALAESGRRFDLSRGPVLRGRVLQESGGTSVLLLTQHHISGDGWSTEVLQGEWQQLYERYASGAPSGLPELAAQYGDYALWQREWPGTALWEEQLGYWRRQLAGAPAVTELPLDGVRGPLVGYRGGVQQVELGAELTAGLEELRRQRGLTMFMVMVGSWKQLLGRYSGQREQVVGTPVAGRNRMELEGLIGCFINTLVLRSEVGWERGLGELLEDEREVVLQAQAHGEVPFEQVVEEVAPERSLSHTPLFQVLVTWQAVGGELGELGAAAGAGVLASKFDLSLSVVQGPGGMLASISYNRELFSASRIQRLGRHWEVLLGELVRDAEQRLGAVELLSAAERQQLVQEWNDTVRRYEGAGVSVAELVVRQAELTPEAVAVVSGAQQLSYGELQRRANQLGHYLRRLGVGPEVKVGICLERSVELVVSLLGTLAAGGCYVPLDPGYPEARLNYMLADAQVAVLLTEAGVSGRLAVPDDVAVVHLEQAQETLAQQPAERPAVTVQGANLAYLIYTSGSTGRPKAVLVPQAGIVNRLLWGQQTYHLGAADVVLQLASFSFDFSVWEVFGTLLAGGRLVIPEGERSADLSGLVGLMREQEVSVVHFVPTLLSTLLSEGALGECRSLRLVMVGGEALPVEVKERYFEQLSAELYNQYGPTEASVDVSYRRCDRESERLVPIGWAIGNTQLYVVDEGLRLAPLGVAGEIVIGGVGLARGYLQQAELTATRFVPDPFSREGGARLYRTGDEGRYRWDGEVEYLGRRDEQVKVRGYRIELGEIEAVLREQAGVREAVVVARGVGEQQQLVGYVVSEVARPSGEWREYLAAKLPTYMVPAVVVSLERLPLTPNGKVDRNKLAVAEFEWKREYEAPRTEVETLLAGIWAEVLGVEQVGVHDNFFELGGHSLVAIPVIARARQVFGVALGVRDLFQRPTVAGLAAAIEDALGVAAGAKLPRQQARQPLPPSLVPIQPNGKKLPLFLIHPAGGFVFSYTRLAHHIGHYQPIYGLQAHGVDGDLDPHTSVEAMAAEYVKAIRVVQPEGPYQLGGWSFGGIVAFETAQQLQAQGQKVKNLVLIDSFAPQWKNRLLKKAKPGSRANLLFLFGRQLGVPAERAHSIIEHKGHSPTEALDQILEEARTLNIFPANADNTFVRRLYDLLALHVEMVERYRPQPYNGRLVLLRASEALAAGSGAGPLTSLAQQWLASKADWLNGLLGRRTNGWERLAKTGVEVQDVPGNHFAMIGEPNVRILAEHLTASLETEMEHTNDGSGSDSLRTDLKPMDNNVRSEALALTNVRKAFDTLVAVNDVNLTVYKGEIFGLLGPNGAGKTTLIRMIMDIIRADSGSIKIFGHPLRDEDKERIGYLPEERGLYARQKVFSTLEYFARLKGLSKQEARAKAHEWLERLQLTEVRDKKVGELSKGNQQRVQLIATLIADPEIVILDEPLSGLDPVGARTIISLIRDLAVAGKTVVLSSHQMGHVELLCERVLMINKGRTVLYGDLSKIKQEYSDNALLLQSTADYAKCNLITRHLPVNGSVKVYLKDGATPRDLVAWILETGAEITSLEPATTSLEEIFINVVDDKK